MKNLSIIAFLFCACAISSMFSAEAPEVEMRETVDAALDVLYSDCYQNVDKHVKVREVIEQRYDLSVIIRRAIGRNWTLLKEEEQGCVVELIKQLIVKAYIAGLEGKERPSITFDKTVQISDKRIEIPSIVLLDGNTYRVLYRFGHLESGWQIYDIVAEDISVVSNYRQQFDDHFRKESGAELIEKLQELLKKEDPYEDIKI
jgi:phospholipid transport system substrate-binding protein